MTADLPIAFFCYPSQPESLSDTIRRAIGMLTTSGIVVPRSWEDLRGAGTLVIDPILTEIHDSAVSCFEVTSLNHNVLFELGYAIGSDRRVYLLRDPTDLPTQRPWKQFALLTTVRFRPYINAREIHDGFLEDQPHSTGATIFSSSIEPLLQESTDANLLLIRSIHETEADRALTDRCYQENDRSRQCIIDDVRESSFHPLTWYGQQVYAAAAVIIHFSSPRRELALVHNARCALIAGLAHGLRKPLLMLADDDYTSPVDYRDLVFVYRTADQCRQQADDWLKRVLPAAAETLADRRARRLSGLRLATELRALRLGEHVAENEIDALEDYFVETAPYYEVLAPKTTIFVGRKGTGKTANLIRAARHLEQDRRNLVVVIKPVGYELESLVRLLARFSERDIQSYLVESLWKFLIYTEIALAARADISRNPDPPAPGTADAGLIEYITDPTKDLTADFAVRLEQAVERLQGVPREHSLSRTRTRISEALHSEVLRDLRQLLGRVLTRKRRVAILIDNLDKPWDKETDIDRLTSLLLGLLGCAGRVPSEFSKRDRWRDPVQLTVGVFLRSDIFARLMAVAREPDKIPVARLRWTDPDMLCRVVEERFIAARGGRALARELWESFFVDAVGGVPTRDYLLSRVLARPRDILYLCNAAIAEAVNRGHERISQEDITQAERLYSQFAFEAIQVENGVSVAELERVLYEFVGVPSVVTTDDLDAFLERAEVSKDRRALVLSHLVSLSFLGIEVDEDRFDWCDDPADRARNDALGRVLAEKRGAAARLSIHPAFRAFLGVTE